MSMSSLTSGLGVVRSLSPEKIEFAPAKKHKACPSVLMLVRPAERRTCVVGNKIRAVATMRTISHIETVSMTSIGVPLTGTSALIGTDSGCGMREASVINIAARSSILSPIPIIPPLHTVMFVLRTFSIV
ncbi:hypothetical protein D3C81_1175410 [compost metagenome]